MNYYQCSLTDGSKSVRSLDAAATDILREDRRNRRPALVPVDLLSERDAARRDRRRKALVQQNSVVLELFLSTDETRSAEDILLDQEDRALVAATLRRILERFSSDKTVKAVIVTAVLDDISFYRTKQLAEACRVHEDAIRSAKERLKYYARTQKDPPAAVA